MLHTTEVAVSLEKNYTVTIGRDLWDEIMGFCAERYSPQKAVIIIDERVNGLHADAIRTNLSEYFETVSFFTIPEGEKSKSIEQWNKMTDSVLKQGIERSTPLFAVGGGVTGDLGGFVASTALRGIPLVHLPTSLLAMVDSSIGGKTGINHSTGKNLIGAFYQPDAVFSDIGFLATLKEKEWVNGLSEILKYAAISDPSLFQLAADCMDYGCKPSPKWEELIFQSANIKIDIVTRDTLEEGTRAFLNFGHTFGHALEKKAGYGTISHGEAVFTGMLAAVKASNEYGSKLQPDKLTDFLDFYSFDLRKNRHFIEGLIEAMGRDKKVQDGEIRLVLLKDWGQPYLQPCNDKKLLEEAWKFAFTTINNE